MPQQRREPFAWATCWVCDAAIRRLVQVLDWVTSQSFHNIRVQHPILLQIMRNGILRQKRRLKLNLSPNPFAFIVRGIRRVLAVSAAAILRPKFGALDLVELLDLAPGLIADGAGNIDFEPDSRHCGP